MTKQQFKFNASEVTCNGNIGGSANVLTPENTAKLTAFLNMHFMMVDKKVLLQELEDSDRINMCWEVGTRASSTVEIINRMVSGLVTYGLKKFTTVSPSYREQRTLAEMWVNAQVNKMTAAEIITIMEAALIDCATADYYYSYEKQW